jgi:hypothetical protein
MAPEDAALGMPLSRNGGQAGPLEEMIALRLVETRTFASGVVYVRYVTVG